jgi:hypothetical protein
MQRVLGPYITAGVALAGASMIAVTPAAPPLSTIQMPAVQLTSGTDSLDLLSSLETVANDLTTALTGSGGSLSSIGSDLSGLLNGSGLDLGNLLNLSDPTTTYPVITPTEFFSDTLQNLQADAAAILANPTPILTQLIANWTAYAQDIGMGLQSAGSSLVSSLQGLPAALDTAFMYLSTGDVFDAVTGLYSYVIDGLLGVGEPVISGLSQVIQGITTNIANLGQDAESLIEFGALSLVPPLYAPVVAAAGLAQNLVTGVSTGNIGEVLTTLLNGPTTLLSAPLNGYDDVSCPLCTIDPTAGLLTGVPGSTQPSEADGSIGIILLLQQTIAQALGADPSGGSQDSLTGILDGVLSGQSSALSTLGSDLTALLSGSGLSDLSGLATDLSGLSTDLLNLF